MYLESFSECAQSPMHCNWLSSLEFMVGCWLRFLVAASDDSPRLWWKKRFLVLKVWAATCSLSALRLIDWRIYGVLMVFSGELFVFLQELACNISSRSCTARVCNCRGSTRTKGLGTSSACHQIDPPQSLWPLLHATDVLICNYEPRGSGRILCSVLTNEERPFWFAWRYTKLS